MIRNGPTRERDPAMQIVPPAARRDHHDRILIMRPCVDAARRRGALLAAPAPHPAHGTRNNRLAARRGKERYTWCVLQKEREIVI